MVALGLAGAVMTACGMDAEARLAEADATLDPTPALIDPDGLTPAQFWNASTIYFLLTDRFYNGDPSNDNASGRVGESAVLRGYEGGDLAGLRMKIEEGYFDELGVNAIWLTPFVEQIEGGTNEGTGITFGFHGYWTRDWTAVEPNLGSAEDVRAVVQAAHARGIRVLMDAVIQHTGPVTDLDPAWPSDWVRTSPACTYQDYATTVDCTLVRNLPDILTGSDEEVDLPPQLVAKWEAEGRLEQERAELDAYFERTGHPRAPRYYLIKWLTDWVREMGFDGYRIDTAKHFEESVSAELKAEAEVAFADFRSANPDEIPSDLPFWFMGEVYNYVIQHGRDFPFGQGDVVDFYDYGYDALINFDFRSGRQGMDQLFSDYAARLSGELDGLGIVNYASSHDDGSPYDRMRLNPYGTGTRLLLAPGGAQIYYGDEVARPLQIEGAEGDANLRSGMEWSFDAEERAIREHWARLGRFRAAHPAIGAGRHTRLQESPYVFARILEGGERQDRVVVALDQPAGAKSIPVGDVFPDGTSVRDVWSGVEATVRNGRVEVDTPEAIVLLEAS